jgi:hypothetical protein
MVWKGLIIFALLASAKGQTPSASTPRNAQADIASQLDAQLKDKLLTAKRVYLDSFGEDPINKALQAMVLDALRASKRFIVTENKEKADLVLKGAALEKTTQEAHALGSATSVAGAAGGGSASVTGFSGPAGGSLLGSSSGGFVTRQLGVVDSQSSVETLNDARIAVRLVSNDGDVVWSTTQESKGAKYKGAMADAADKVVRQLLRDLEKLSHPPAPVK